MGTDRLAQGAGDGEASSRRGVCRHVGPRTFVVRPAARCKGSLSEPRALVSFQRHELSPPSKVLGALLRWWRSRDLSVPTGTAGLAWAPAVLLKRPVKNQTIGRLP